LPRLSEIVLGRLIEQKPLSRIEVSVQDKDFAYTVS